MSQLVVRQEALLLDRWPTAFHDLRVVHVSDFHFRRWNRILDRLRRFLLEARYDLLLLTGDFCVEPKNHPLTGRMLRRLMADLEPALGAFAVLGNHDGPEIIPALDHIGVRVLRNESVIVQRGSDALTIAGIEQVHGNSGDLTAALSNGSSDRATILLAHYPSTIHSLPPGTVDLLLAGHTHAGQWRLPWLGCVWAHDHLSPKHAWGLHHINGTYLHVTAGIGISGPFFCRINCPPEVTHFTLQSPQRVARP